MPGSTSGLAALQAHPVQGRTMLSPRGWGCPILAHGPRGGRGTPASLPNRGHHPMGHISPHHGGRVRQGEGLHGQRGRGGRAMLRRGRDPGWGNLAVHTARTPRALCVTSAQDPAVSPGLVGDCLLGKSALGYRETFSLPPPNPIGAVSHAGVTPGVPDSQPQQQLPPGWGKVRSIPHSQGDRGKL